MIVDIYEYRVQRGQGLIVICIFLFINEVYQHFEIK